LLPRCCPGEPIGNSPVTHMQNAKKVLTDRGLKALRPAAPGKRYDRMDAIVPGLGVRVTDKGHKTFVLAARFPGKPNYTRRELGPYGALTLEAARTIARRWLEMIRAGVDPKHDEERRQRERLRKQASTFAAVAEEFFKRHVAKTRKGREVERDMRREFVDRWAARPITEIDRHDVMAVIDAAVDRGAPYQAHNLLGYIRRLFNWAIARGTYGLESSPCDRLRPGDAIGKKAMRSRVLTDPELRAFWKATEPLGYPYCPLFRLLALTGQRKSEVAEARWGEFDLSKKLWVIPPERVKADAAHVVPLSDDALATLKSLPTFKKGDHVFSTTFGVKAVNGFAKAKVRLDKDILAELRGSADDDKRQKIKLEPFVLHDLRRTMRTGLSALPVPDLVRELVIAHTKPGLHKVYDQYAYLDEKRRALDLWAARLRSIITSPPDNVVAMPTRA
jgi:integrase